MTEGDGASETERQEALSGVSDDLLDTSGEILRRIREMRQLEERKRAEGIATEDFQRLAEEVDRRAREIWQLAARQGVLARQQSAAGASLDEAPDRTLEEVDASRHAAEADGGRDGDGGESHGMPRHGT